MAHYALVKSVSTSFEATLEAATEALQKEGFGIMSTINVSGAFKKKINVDYPRTVILGACNPGFAHKALLADVDMSVFMPCNVVVRETAEGNVEVAVFNPDVIEQVVGKADVTAIAQQIKKHLQAALDQLS
ncbi:DUF302 domain-containing protein [Magnetococcales bacterium HHB-1]